MITWGAIVAVVLLSVAITWSLLSYTLHRIAIARLESDRADRPARLMQGRELVPRFRWPAVAVGAALGFAIAWLIGRQVPYQVAGAAIGAALAVLTEDLLAQRRLLTLETQLADAVDLLVGALQAGAGLGTSLTVAADSARMPLRPLLDDMSRRLRLGDDPAVVFAEPARRVPLPGFRLFALSVGTQWEAGGSLAPALSLVGRSVRDRIALARRVGSQSTAAVGSMIAILLITYFVGLLMWLWEPDRVEGFLATRVGSIAVSVAMVLQALGLLWAWRITKIRF